MGRMEHMFDAIDTKEVAQQSLQVAVWVQAQAAAIEANAWSQLWRSSPWWFQLMMLVYAASCMYAVAKRFARRLGVRL